METDVYSDTSGARVFAWLAATLSVAALLIFGAAFAATAEASKLLLIFGLPPWAGFGAWSGFIAGILGLVTLIKTQRVHRNDRLPFDTTLGPF